MIHRYTWIKIQLKDEMVTLINKYFYLCVITLLGTETSFLFQFIKLGKSLLIIDDVSRGNNKQSE